MNISLTWHASCLFWANTTQKEKEVEKCKLQIFKYLTLVSI